MFGILNCNKPVGATSRDVVDVVARRLRPAKVGHAGTLDPLAEGVLVLAVGPASRLVPYLHLYPKTYEATFLLGHSSPSADLEFPPTEHPTLHQPTQDEIVAAAARLTGRIEQTPPLYSAVKVGGKRAYKAARAAQEMTLPSRTVDVHRFEIVAYEFPNVRAVIECGSGTYIRSLGVDLAALCGTRAVMSSLRRTAVGPFTIDEAHPLHEIRSGGVAAAWLRPPSEGTRMLRQVQLTDEEQVEILHGRTIRHGWTPPLEACPWPPSPRDEAERAIAEELAALAPGGQLQAILIPRDGGWGPRRVFPRPDQPAPTA
ncbi:tRNA pseudouridine(55) synthase TruB [Candidatus Laterigemmans baculatus]|uniref:tRNA pseudouridine(55) synthase TruB n=1 Tax=Candidatus Laterigemmans baculatus TaxID=2770505 RepID=UPI0013DCFD9B|nr:tRNA pseudouridine(55) synthase TruB [Candidatus Laterigemmans baculatus]